MSTMAVPVAAPEPDGRRQRGDASRRVILDAASRLIAEAGVAALTHRVVAEAAGVSLARVSYHFPKIDDLMVAAATQYLQAFDDRLRSMAERARVGELSLVDTCTEVLHELVTDGAPEFLGMVEVRLALARRRRTVADTGIVAVIRSFGADQRRAMSIAAAMFGFAVLAAAEPAAVTREQVRDHVRTVLGVAS
jgi:DNA-binding transcriptional regulator YbjK